MRYDYKFRAGGYAYFFPRAVKWLLISNIAIFVISFFTARFEVGQIFNLLALSPELVLKHFAIWQLVTYMFLHGSFGHILFNMLTLWMFGMDLERDWGTKRFLKYYFICGIGAGLCDVLVNAALGHLNTRTIGSSGAIYGLLLAFGVLYPDRVVVMIIGAIAFMSSLGSSGSGVSNVAHLGGMLFGYLYLRMRFPQFNTGDLI